MRFPGFEGEWETKKLEEIADKVNSGKTPLGGEDVYTKKGVLFIRSQNVNNDRLELNNSVFIPESVNNQMKNSIVRSNDILLNITGASLGRSCVVPEDFKIGNVNQHVCIIRLKQNYNSRFIQPIFSSYKGQNIFNSLQTGSGREGLNFESIKGIKLSIPQKNEQQKIADFLSLIDERITTQNKIIEELEQLIKGLCQKLFHNRNNKDWSEQSLEDVLEERKELNTDNYTVHSVSVSKGVINQIEYLGRSFAAKDTKNYNVVHYGDIVYTKSPTGEFPYGIIKQSFIKERVAVSPLYGVFKVKNFYMANILHFYFSNPINVQNYLQSIIQKGAKNTISITNQSFLKKRLYLPIDEKEIKKISSLLSAIESKKTVEMNILERLKNQKKHFLQQMFI
ncbi:restriction endonuclease subunit S [Myroides odoratimimus]|uniref:restriction endonuclease subunit S n=1 Tax=Myroides odoratimimus TaxID=76832 RepID=UPI002576DC68|nr:restriction endonuclease subunit S [Myroides odoratimimus]